MRLVLRKIPGLLLFATLCLPLCAAAETGEILRGPAFSDPEEVFEPDGEWTDLPLHYPPQYAGVDLLVDMNQQLYPFLLPLIEDFAKREKITVEVLDGTCGKAAGRLNRKEVDIGGFCCPPWKLDRLPGLRFHTLGISALAILTHPENKVEEITLDQARAIFRGEITSWSAVGGADEEIELISSLHCAKRPGHWRLLLDNPDLFSTRLREVGDLPDQIKLIASTPNAIGYETLWIAESFRNKGEVKALRIDGMHPSSHNVLAQGSYPLYRVYNLTTWEGENLRNPHAEGLVDFLLRQSKELDPKYGLIASQTLRRQGWTFTGGELTGEPEPGSK